jgi:small subunit ribosomal protein S14
VAKKSKIEREARLKRLNARYGEKLEKLRQVINDPDAAQEDKMDAYRQLRRIPRNAHAVRQRNRCDLTGRPRGYLRKFRLCRIAFRELAHEAKLPGVTKSSW